MLVESRIPKIGKSRRDLISKLSANSDIKNTVLAALKIFRMEAREKALRKGLMRVYNTP
jgi:hypothetical protein